jgi:hypothetical protein
MENRNSDSYHGKLKFMQKHIPTPTNPSSKVEKGNGERKIIMWKLTLTQDFKTQTYLREEQIFDLQGLPKPLTVTAFQPESYLILPIKPKICNTEFLKQVIKQHVPISYNI